MKKFYFELTFQGKSSTFSTLGKALEATRKNLDSIGIKDWKKLIYQLDSSKFTNQNLESVLVGESVKEIPDTEFNRLKKTSKEPDWVPDSKLTLVQKESVKGFLSAKSSLLLDIPNEINELNRDVINPKARAVLRLNSQLEIGVYDGSREIYTIDTKISEISRKPKFGIFSKASFNKFHEGIKGFQNLFRTIRERFAVDKNCDVNEVEISIGQDIKELIQKLAKYQEVCVSESLKEKYREPIASIRSIDFESGLNASVKEIDTYLDKIEPVGKISESIPSVETSNLGLNKNGIFSNINDAYTSHRILKAVERIKSVDGCVCSKDVRELPIDKKKNPFSSTLGYCQRDGVIALKVESPDEISDDLKGSKIDGWLSTECILGTFIHEDTHAMVNFIMSVFGSQPIEDEFTPLVKELRSYAYSEQGEILSKYAATTSKTGSKCQEMVAEARAEIICEGKNSRPFARRVYTVLMGLYKKALEVSKK